MALEEGVFAEICSEVAVLLFENSSTHLCCMKELLPAYGNAMDECTIKLLNSCALSPIPRLLGRFQYHLPSISHF